MYVPFCFNKIGFNIRKQVEFTSITRRLRSSISLSFAAICYVAIHFQNHINTICPAGKQKQNNSIIIITRPKPAYERPASCLWRSAHNKVRSQRKKTILFGNFSQTSGPPPPFWEPLIQKRQL